MATTIESPTTPKITPKTTRSVLFCPFFGAPSALPLNKLPTKAQILRYYPLVKERIMIEKVTNKPPKTNDVAMKIAIEVLDIWERSNIPYKNNKYKVRDQIVKLRDDYIDHREWYQDKRNVNKIVSEIGQDMIEEYRRKSTVLFDLARCSSTECTSNKRCKIHRSMEDQDIDFYIDQKLGLRIGKITNSVDTKVTEKWELQYKLKEQEETRIENEKKRKTEQDSSTIYYERDSVNICGDETVDAIAIEEDKKLLDKDWLPLFDRVSKQLKNFRRYPRFAMACIRHAGKPFSLRAAADIANALLADIGFLNKYNMYEIILPSKIAHEKDLIRIATALHHKLNLPPIRCIFIDSKKDETLVNEITEIGHRMVKYILNHYTILSEPGSYFIDAITVKEKADEDVQLAAQTDKDILKEARRAKDELFAYFERESIDLSKLEAIGSDAASTNTGHLAGIIRRLEIDLGRPLQWLICLIHFNELPLKHLFRELDGDTTSGNSYSGPIGNLIMGEMNDLPIASFEPIKVENFQSQNIVRFF